MSGKIKKRKKKTRRRFDPSFTRGVYLLLASRPSTRLAPKIIGKGTRENPFVIQDDLDNADCSHSEGDCPTDWDSELDGDFGGMNPTFDDGTPERLEKESEELVRRWGEWEAKMKKACCKRKYYKYNT
ncbi:hypothetical protein BJ508DRAFT_315752 [Ascobolus immersus RN42]|uniref:Uncharacterized protein n=1 Tax=Ascobolus immersus RN42 TaxID=1160509 RepID=A0A3N4HNQ5_ASCIM|nr:hypothetical protein BJ508DRAFT_315752 [Ascobolus immersus RN42]